MKMSKTRMVKQEMLPQILTFNYNVDYASQYTIKEVKYTVAMTSYIEEVVTDVNFIWFHIVDNVKTVNKHEHY